MAHMGQALLSCTSRNPHPSLCLWWNDEAHIWSGLAKISNHVTVAKEFLGWLLNKGAFFFFFFKNSLHLLTFYCNKAGFYPEELFKLSRCHVNYRVVSMVQTDYEGSKNHTQASSGVNWHHPIEFADCTVYSHDAGNIGDTSYHLQNLYILLSAYRRSLPVLREKCDLISFLLEMLEGSISDLHFSCEDPFSIRSALLSNISSLKLLKHFMSSKKILFLFFYTQNIQYLLS